MIRTAQISLFSFTLVGVAGLLAGCKDKDGQADDTGVGDGGSGDGGGKDYEEGCILVDDEGGYAWINDAIEVAQEGSTISLCAEDLHEEEVVVDKAVFIEGPGTSYFTLTGPTNKDAMTITADGAKVRAISVTGTRNGIVVDKASDVTLSQLQVLDAGNWGVSAEAADGLSLYQVVLTGNGYGGASFDGGDASLGKVTASANERYGIVATGDASVAIEESEISGTIYTGDGGTDGLGVAAEDGAVVSVATSTFSANEVIGYFANKADTILDGNTFTGGSFAVYALDGEVSINDVTIEDATVIGVLIDTSDPVTISGLSTTADPDASASLAYDEWGAAGIDGTGVAVFASEIDLADVSVSGWNNAGIVLVSDGGAATLEGITIDNVGHYGIYAQDIDVTMTTADVGGTRTVDPDEEALCYFVNFWAGIYGIYANWDLYDVSVHDNEGWGVSLVYGDLAASGSTFSAGACSTVVSYEGSLSLTSNTFTGAPTGGAINTNYSTGDTIEGNTFTANQLDEDYVVEYDYTDTSGYKVTYTYGDGYPSAADIGIADAASVSIKDNVFEDGDTGITLSGSKAVVSGNSWSNYRSYPLYVTASSTVEFSDNTVEKFQVYGVGCADSTLEISDSTFTDENTLTYEFSYLYTYTDGSTSGYSYENSDDGDVFSGNGCNLTMSNVTVSDVEGTAFYTYSNGSDGTYELKDVTFETIGTGRPSYGAFYMGSYNGTTELYLTDVTISDARYSDAMQIAPYYAPSSGYEPSLSMQARGLVIDGSKGDAISLRSQAITADLDGVTISDAGVYGLFVDGSTVTLTDASITGSGNSGIYLDSGTVSVTDSVVTGNGGYGMECLDVTLSVCEGNDFDSNTDGEWLDCDACGGTGDGGASDGGAADGGASDGA